MLILVWILFAGIAFFAGPIGWIAFWATLIISSAVKQRNRNGEEQTGAGPSMTYFYVLVAIFALVGLYNYWILHQAGP